MFNAVFNLTFLFLLLLSTIPGIAQWNISSFQPSPQLREVTFPTPEAAYCSAYAGVIYKSSDAGKNWAEVYDFGPFVGLTDLQFLNADTGFVSAWAPWRTVDGGHSWTIISPVPVSQNGSPMKRVKIAGERLYSTYTGNDTAYLMVSHDYGDTWTHQFQHQETGAKPYLFSFPDPMNGFLINPNELEEVYRTNDGGLTFDTIHITNGPMILQEQWDFKDVQYGYFYGSWGSESHPTRTWNTLSFYFPTDLDGFGVLPVLDLDYNTSKLYASSLYGKIFYSTSHGTLWTEQTTPTTAPILSIAFANDTLGIAVSDHEILFTANGGFTGLPELFNTQNYLIYPNPATGSFRLQTTGDDKMFSIQVQDMNGRYLLDLDPADLQHDISALSAGLYIVQIETSERKIFERLVVR